MIKFIVLVAALVLLATSFVLGPVTLARIREHGFRDGRSYAAVAALLLAAGALVFYVNVGMPTAVGPSITVEVENEKPIQAHIASRGATSSGDASSMSLQDAALKLEGRLAVEPTDAAGWALLAATYRQLGEEENAERAEAHQLGTETKNPTASAKALFARLIKEATDAPKDLGRQLELARMAMSRREYQFAVDAFGRALAIDGENSKLFADAADAHAALNGKIFDEKADQLVQQAISLDPSNRKALWLAGTSAFQKKNWEPAKQQWQALLGLLPPDGSEYKAVKNNLASVQAMRTLPKGSLSSENNGASEPVAKKSISVGGKVKISTELIARAKPEDTVFVFARAVGGPKMPLAIVRKTAGDLPLSFQLDDSMSMAPGAKISMHSEVIIGARISKSGNAIAQNGDLEGFSQPARVGTENISVVINSVVAR